MPLQHNAAITNWIGGATARRVTLQQAQAELNTVQQGLALRYPDDDRDMTSVSLTGEMESVVGDVRQPLRILFAAVGVLLLIACANAAGLFLTRSSNRIAELSIRAALGASRRVLARHLLIEALSLALCGGLCGAGLAALVLPTGAPVPPGESGSYPGHRP